jgi:CHASE2 domain-containing sensor protein
VPFDDQSQVHVELPRRDDLEFVSFADFLSGHLSPDTVKDRIVIIGYDGASAPLANTPVGKMKIHRAFCYGLLAVYEEMEGVGLTTRDAQ